MSEDRKTSLALWQERLLERVGQCSCSIASDEREQRVIIRADLFCRRCHVENLSPKTVPQYTLKLYLGLTFVREDITSHDD